MRFLARLVLNGFAIIVAAWLLPGLHLSGPFAALIAGAILGFVNARIILTVAFVLILTPMGLIWRLIGRDPLARRRDQWPGWVAHPERYRRLDHYTRMY